MQRKLRILVLWSGIILAAGSAHATSFLKVLKSDAVVGYKEPTSQSKIITVFAKDDEVEITGDGAGWFKVKISFSQGYFIYGWVQKNNGNMRVISKDAKSESLQAKAPEEKEDPEETSGKSGGSRNISLDLESTSDEHTMVKFFAGPVYSLYRYGAFQYRAGLSYEVPMSQSWRLGFPISYMTGDGFSALQFGIEGMRSFFMGPFAVVPRGGLGYEYFYGAGKSFHAGSVDLGAAIEISLSSWLILGVEPFVARAMVWNSTDSLSKIPWNIRGESMILLRGHW